MGLSRAVQNPKKGRTKTTGTERGRQCRYAE